MPAAVRAGRRSAPRARTLPDALRALPTAALADLLTHRPDLVDPAPRDITELAITSTTAASIARALDQLDAWQRLVAEALAALPDPTSVDEVATLLDGAADDVTRAVADLRARALLWGHDEDLHLVRPVREAFLPYPGGLAPATDRPLGDDEIDDALVSCSPVAVAVLERLLWSPTGVVRNAEREVSPETARSPVDELLSRRLLRPLDGETVILPREVSWRLRSGRFAPAPVAPTPPPVTGRARDARLVDRAGAGAAYGLVHDVELVARVLEDVPHRLLRTGGLGSRDLAALARRLGGDLDHASFVVECAAAAGLVAPNSAYLVLPTLDHDDWAQLPTVDRWRRLAEGWRGVDRLFARSADPGAHTLGHEADTPVAADLRAVVLSIARAAEPGQVLDLDQLAAAVAWRRPRLAGGTLTARTVVGWTWREAEWLGLVALGAPTRFLAIVDGPTAPVPEELRALFPAPVDRLVIQADLTAVAGGPLEHAMATELRLLADQESRGGGGVFRFSAGSVRRAFDAGWTRDAVQTWIEHHSSTGVPQPLAYLVDDVARRHGSVRVGPAGCFIRVADESQAAALLNHPAAAGLGIRRIASGTLVALVDETELVQVLRDLGQAPVVEDASGGVVSAPAVQRAGRVRVAGIDPPDPAAIAAAVQTAERSRPRTPSSPAPNAGSSTDETLAQLRSATEQARPVRIVYANADGTSAERVVAPLDIAGGSVRAVDRQSAQVVTIPLARISSVLPTGNRQLD